MGNSEAIASECLPPKQRTEQLPRVFAAELLGRQGGLVIESRGREYLLLCDGTGVLRLALLSQ